MSKTECCAFYESRGGKCAVHALAEKRLGDLRVSPKDVAKRITFVEGLLAYVPSHADQYGSNGTRELLCGDASQGLGDKELLLKQRGCKCFDDKKGTNGIAKHLGVKR